MKQPNFRVTRRGIALVVTLVILVLLAGLAVGLLQTSGLERGTSKSVAEKAKADLIAQTAANAAINSLVENLTSFPDFATSWDKVLQAKSTSLQYEGTTLYYREQTPEATAAGTPSPMHMLPLISGAQTIQIWPLPAGTTADDAKRNALPALDSTNSYDLNRARFSGDKQGAIGAPTRAAARPEFRGQWINIKNSDNKLTGRYAYWMEDESFKANVNLMGNTLRGGSTVGSTPSDMPLQGLMKVALTSGDPDAVANDLFSFRAKFPNSKFFEYPALNQVTGQATLAESLKFEGTIFSSTSNLSRSGVKRINLNKVVVDSTDAIEIRKQLDEIVNAVKYQLPNFRQRFYRSGSDKNSLDVPESADAWYGSIYSNKLAANIRDYIDTDSQPTIVNNDGDPGSSPPKPFTVRIGAVPIHALRALPTGGATTAGPNEVIAIGKERVPRIQEYALRVRQIVLTPRLGTFADYRISIDHYVEFWNQSNRDIPISDLGSKPFLLIANQPGWDAGSLTNIPDGASRDLRLYLKDATNADPNNKAPLQSFPAGSVTVITTDPQPLNTPGTSSPVQTGPLTPDLSRVFYIPIVPDANFRTYSGQTNKKSSSQLRLNLITRTTSATDYETEIALGNDSGLLESAWGAANIGSTISINADNTTPPVNRFDDTKYSFRGGYLQGDIGTPSPNATTGDPRTNAEQLRYDLNGGTAGNDKTRYYDSDLDSSHIPGNSTLGAPNSNYVNPSVWIDYSSSVQGANTAPAVIANAKMTSIGQLGDIFDPTRTKGDATGTDSDGVAMNIKLSRSGGRTLKIGQPERYDATVNPGGLWDGDTNSVSREWTAWRLTDIFATSDDLQSDGRVNINGVFRDGGVALKAALYGYAFQPAPDSDPGLAGKAFDSDPTNGTDKVNELVKQLQARLRNDADPSVYGGQFGTTAGPLAERGELSELPIFNTGSDLATGTITANVYDRGREEIFRRLVELITTRGSTFTVYVVGQAISPQSAAASPVVTSTSQFKVTFRVDPVWNGATPGDPFDPSDAARFSKPDKYGIKILYAGD